MSFKCTLELDDETYEILECEVLFDQRFDKNGRPASGVHAGNIIMLIENTESEALFSWISDPFKRQDGTITFYNIDEASTFKKIEFEGAYPVMLVESFIGDNETIQPGDENILFNQYNLSQREFIKIMHFHHRTGRSYVNYLQVSAEKINISGLEHDNRW